MNWNGLDLPTAYYQDDAVYIIHGDCREILPSLEKVDLVLTDPPYGIGVNKMQLGNRKTETFYSGDWDSHSPDSDTIAMLMKAGCEQIVFGGNYMNNLPISRGWVVWDKNNGASSFADGELIWTSYDIPLRIKKVHWVGSAPKWEDTKAKVHPTQKPVSLIEYLINIRLVETILDPFLGSGTTAYCAKKLNRKCIGIEIEEKYCEIAAKRCSQSVMRLDI